MTLATPTAAFLDPAGVRTQVDGILSAFLERKALSATAQRLPTEITKTLHTFLSAGGKRIRPLLCMIGWQAGGGDGDHVPTLRAAASLEMFHAFALIHDDIMDNSATRRGRPTVHRAMAARHRPGRSSTAADHLGASAAILIGDLALAWSDELLHTAGLTPGQLAEALPHIDAMRTEVMYGQYLDLTAAGQPANDTERALAIIRYKTAKYTIEGPLHIGAALAGAAPAVISACSAFALPLGEAFQLRDDLLGIFGDPRVTGKPVLDDVREGKNTALVAMAFQRANPGQASLLRSLLGNPAAGEGDVATLREVLKATGAADAVEQMIAERYRQALAALQAAPFPLGVLTSLRVLADTIVWRTS